jgi:hypothetical protein
VTEGQRLQDISICVSSVVAALRQPGGSAQICEALRTLPVCLAECATIMAVPQLLMICGDKRGGSNGGDVTHWCLLSWSEMPAFTEIPVAAPAYRATAHHSRSCPK